VTQKTTHLKVYLGSMKQPWVEHCEKLGKKPGAAIKEIIETQLSQSTQKLQPQPERPVFRQVDEKPDEGAKTRIEIRFTPSEKEKVLELVAFEHCSPQVWIVNVVRATLTHQPQCGINELEALGESNYQLLAIGRNLNQIAKNLNRGLHLTVTLEQIESLRQLIKAHTKHVSRVLRASVERWSIK
jgi:hypothetical protein